MKLGIFAKTFEAIGAQPVLDAVSAAGYATAQFNFACLGLPPMPDRIEPSVAENIGEASRRTGVSIAAISGTYNMIHPDPAIRLAGLGRLEVIARSCAAMGTGLISLCTGTRDARDQWRWHPDNASEAAWSDLRETMDAAVAIADDCGIDLGIEPELANVVSNAEAARRLLDETKSPRLRIILDPANLFEVASDAERRRIIEHAVDILAPSIVMAHAKDRAKDGSFVAAGSGVIDFGHFVECLRDSGFDGPLVTHGLSATEAPQVADFLRRTLRRSGLAS